MDANLRKAKLWGTNLSGANLSSANLVEADLIEDNMQKAILCGADLSKADLRDADLKKADLRHVNLEGTRLNDANLSWATFEPRPSSLTEISRLVGIKGLSDLRFENSTHGLVELRETFKKAGLREQEREVTFALIQTRQLIYSVRWPTRRLESDFRKIFFEWTCLYGMSPGRCLKILIMSVLIFSFPYMLALASRNPKTGIWLVLMPERVLRRGVNDRPFKLTTRALFQKPKGEKKLAKLMAWLRRVLRVIRLGFYFSLLSAFSLNWRDLNVGNWINRIQEQEYVLRATGWPRTLAGLQSVLGIYLLALWVLTYFGRPFG